MSYKFPSKNNENTWKSITHWNLLEVGKGGIAGGGRLGKDNMGRTTSYR